METPKNFYERLRKQGLTDYITSNPEPNYNEPFYQNIFRLMESYAKACGGKYLICLAPGSCIHEDGKVDCKDCYYLEGNKAN